MKFPEPSVSLIVWILFYGLNVLCTTNYSNSKSSRPNKETKGRVILINFSFFHFQIETCFLLLLTSPFRWGDHESLPCLCLILPSRPIMRKGVLLCLFDYHLLLLLIYHLFDLLFITGASAPLCPPSEPIMSKVLSGGDSPLVPRWSPAHTIYMPIARRLRLREASGQWHALGNLFCQYYWLSAQHHHHLEQNTSDHQLSSNRHPCKHHFGLSKICPYITSGVHFSFDVLSSWADQGSCAHKCVC